MRSRTSKVLAAAFFCTCGCIYSVSANGEEATGVQKDILTALVRPADGPLPEDAAAEEPMPAPAPAAADEPAPTPPPAPAPDFVPVAAPAPAPAFMIAPAAQPVATPAVMPAAAAPAADIKPVQMNHNLDLVSLNVQNTDLAQVLQLLSIQSRRNIVPSPKVTGTVTANLYDVTFHEALDAILQQNGAGYVERGNFILIYTLDELKKIQDAERKVSHRIIQLNYMTAQDASTFVTPLLSSAGSIAITGVVGAGFQPTTSDGGANSHAGYETMIVRDYPENIEEIGRMITALDTRPQQVLIEATVLRATLNEDLAFGVDISILADVGGLDNVVGSPLGVVSGMIAGAGNTNQVDTPGAAINTTVGNTATGDAGIKVGVLTDSVQVFVRALDKVTDTTVVANPKIMTLNRQRAEVHVGEKIAYLSTTATATATTQTVEYLDTGTTLSVRPFVSSDGMIRMELNPKISNAELRTAGTGTGAVVLPDEILQELTTNVMVRDGQTVVLGGLFLEETTVERNQVPGLGDIPYLGNAFKGRDDNLSRSEVIFLLTPHILRDKDIAQAGEAAMDGIEQIRIGSREKLLPWSRDKMTAGHLRDALGYLEEGNRDKALWEVDLALGMNPTMVEAQRLKEKLTGERAYWPKDSLLDDAVDLMIERKIGKPSSVPAVPINPNPAPGKLQPVPGGRSSEMLDPRVEAQMEKARKAAAEAEADNEPATQPAMDKTAEKPADVQPVKLEPAPPASSAIMADPAPAAAPKTESKDAEKKVEPAPAEPRDEAGDEAEAKSAPAAVPAPAEQYPGSQPEEAKDEAAPAPAADEPKQEVKEEAKPVDPATAKLLKDFGKAGK